MVNSSHFWGLLLMGSSVAYLIYTVLKTQKMLGLVLGCFVFVIIAALSLPHFNFYKKTHPPYKMDTQSGQEPASSSAPTKGNQKSGSQDSRTGKHSAEDHTGKPPWKTTPCTMKGGHWFTSAKDAPGGSNLNRPGFELEDVIPYADWADYGNKYILFTEYAITSRGEDSIIKDWELCLVRDNKAVFYYPTDIPGGEITLPNGEKITNDKLLTESAVRNPIPHGHRVVGWVAFSVTKDLEDEVNKNKAMTMAGSVRFKDYLGHTYSYEASPGKPYTGNGTEYIPGKEPN